MSDVGCFFCPPRPLPRRSACEDGSFSSSILPKVFNAEMQRTQSSAENTKTGFRGPSSAKPKLQSVNFTNLRTGKLTANYAEHAKFSAAKRHKTFFDTHSTNFPVGLCCRTAFRISGFGCHLRPSPGWPRPGRWQRSLQVLLHVLDEVAFHQVVAILQESTKRVALILAFQAVQGMTPESVASGGGRTRGRTTTCAKSPRPAPCRPKPFSPKMANKWQ